MGFIIWEKEDVETDKRLMDETRVVEGHSMASDSASRYEGFENSVSG